MHLNELYELIVRSCLSENVDLLFLLSSVYYNYCLTNTDISLQIFFDEALFMWSLSYLFIDGCKLKNKLLYMHNING